MTNRTGILVVDDTSAALKLLTDILTAEGYQVRPANSGELALASVAAKPPELILLDIRMPGLDGFEVCRRLKSCEESRDIPVIFISAVAALEDRVEGFALGAVDFVSKPFQREELLARVRTHLELSRLRTSLEARVHERTMELRKAYDALRESEEKHRSLYETMAQGVVYQDAMGRILSVNPAAERILGLTLNQMQGRVPADHLFADIIHEDGSTFPAEMYPCMVALRTGAPVLSTTMGIFNPVSKDRRWIQVDAIPCCPPGGTQPTQVYVIFADITEIIELDQLKDQFILVAAHELKTPVAIMKGYAQALQRSAEKISEPRRTMLDAISRGADRINAIAQNLLDISRIHRGQIQLMREKVNLTELVTDVTNRIALRTDRHTIRLVRETPVIVQGDRERLEMVLTHLLDNAIRYSPQGGDIDIALVVRDHAIIVSIADHGVGIPPSKQRHIFERFYCAHTGTPYDFGGMGVGLYISKEIIQRHGGRMWFESKEGKGSTFSFSLPLEGEQSA
ncbi:MAG: hybrid sensor histidine kinase/response regulator [Chloroflexota bacterium]|nr:MAG: hybrid sensor histidine kinase/response regulator [Chloroflexota bacterium]